MVRSVSTIELIEDERLTTSQLVEKRSVALINALENNYNGQYPNDNQSDWQPRFKLELGRKYWKINETNGGVHAFVDRNNGNVFKPASYKSPAKHVRYNLLDESSFNNCISRADWCGSYLYLR